MTDACASPFGVQSLVGSHRFHNMQPHIQPHMQPHMQQFGPPSYNMQNMGYNMFPYGAGPMAAMPQPQAPVLHFSEQQQQIKQELMPGSQEMEGVSSTWFDPTWPEQYPVWSNTEIACSKQV